MAHHPRAGQPAQPEQFVDLARLEQAYYQETPDPAEIQQRVSFGTSGHRGSSLKRTFNEAHILAITQAICEYRMKAGTTGPLFIGKDTHALSSPAQRTALEVLTANGIQVRMDKDDGYTPTPVMSHAIIQTNRGRTSGFADGIIVTPSHNPPEDGGFKYNPPHGGPADTDVTKAIENRANELLAAKLQGVKRMPYEQALRAASTTRYDFAGTYIADLAHVVDLDRIKAANVRLGVDPLGGAAVAYWRPLAERYGLNLEIVNESVDPTFRFMTLDWDGKIRMDCSSPYAMASLITLKNRFDLAFGNDTDTDRHGIVTPGTGLMNPNHYLAAAISYLFTHRPGWNSAAGIGKTVVSSSIIDRLVRSLKRRLVEVPVGFKWFVPGLSDGSLGFGGEESAGAAFLRLDGTTWVTDKDGIIMNLLAAEMLAVTGKDPAQLYGELTAQLGEPVYERIDAPATRAQKAALQKFSPQQVRSKELAGEPIIAMLTEAPGNKASIGGLKVTTANGWFAARPSGTEDVYKLYAESFKGQAHLLQIQEDAQALIKQVFSSAGA